MMSEIGEAYRAWNEEKKAKKSQNRDYGEAKLKELGVAYESKNHGNHLIIERRIDYWPSTGKWIVRGGKSGRGIRGLLKHLGVVYAGK